MAYVNSVVTFIDVLGFSALVCSDPSGDRVLKVASKLRLYGTEDLDGRRASLRGTAIQFSDCVVRCTPVRDGNDPLPDIRDELEELTYLQGELLAEGILLRGGLVVGSAHIGSDGVLGPAVVEAHILESKHAVYPRIVLHPDVTRRFATDGESGPGVYADDELRLTRASDDGLQFVDYLCNFPREVHTDPSPYREETARSYMAPRKDLIEHELARLKPLDMVRAKYAWLGRYHNEVAREILGNAAADVIVGFQAISCAAEHAVAADLVAAEGSSQNGSVGLAAPRPLNGQALASPMDHFLHLVRNYVALIESRHSLSAIELLRGAAKVLPSLYAAGLDLPDRSPTEDEVHPSAKIPSPMADLARILGPWDLYSEVFDPRTDTDAIHQTLSDDLADIYIDLKCALDVFDSGATDDAIWSWRFTLAGHCGDHIVDALRVIHRRIHEDVFRLAAG